MFDSKAYKRAWMRNHRANQKRMELISQGKCPISEILLTSKYHEQNCPCEVRIGYILVSETTTIIEYKLPQNNLDTTPHSL